MAVRVRGELRLLQALAVREGALLAGPQAVADEDAVMPVSREEYHQFLREFSEALREVPHRGDCRRSGAVDHRCTCDVGERLMRLHRIVMGFAYRNVEKSIDGA